MHVVSAAWYRARSELRRRLPAILLLVAIVGLAGGAVLTCVAGARRSSTSYERFRQETLASDLDIARDGPPRAIDDLRDLLERLPQVAAISQPAFPFIVPAGSGLYPYLDFLAFLPDDQATVTIDLPRVLEGRLPSPDDSDEMAVLSLFAEEAGVGVGDRVTFDSYAPDQLEPLFTGGDAGPPGGPAVTLEVAGIVDAPTFVSESVGSFVPRVFLSPAFRRAHPDDIATYPGGLAVRLHGGADDVAAVTDAVLAELGDDPTLEMQPASEVDAKIDSSVDVIVSALLVSALVAALAGAVAVGQAIGRHFTRGSEATGSGSSIHALGMTRRERVASLLATVVPVAVGGAAAAAVVAIVASPLMPVGLARRAEPDPGFDVDAWVLTVGAVVIALAVMLLATLAAIPAATRTAAPARDIVDRSRSWLTAPRSTLPPAAAVGMDLALHPRRGTATSVRAALGGVAFGVLGVVAVAVFAVSLSTLVDSPARYGAPWDAMVYGFSTDVEGLAAELDADDDAVETATLLSTFARVDGEEIPLHAVERRKGDVGLTILEGRAPSAEGEVALGSSTMETLGVRFGDEIDIDSELGATRATVVGRAAFPVIDERSSVGAGILMTADELAAIAEESVNHDLVIVWRDGLDEAAATQALAERTGAQVTPPLTPSDVNNLRDVRNLPYALGAFLAALAALAIVHALVSTVRLRRHDLAVLRTLGFERRQLAATVASQATAIAAVGVVVGVPLGLVAGRLAWRAVAEGIGVVGDPSTPVVLVAVVAVAGLGVANLAAALPARRASRVGAASVLRTG
jgi:hypothetical protein